MKNFFKLFRIIALAAVIGVSMMSCKTDDDDNDEGNKTSTFTLKIVNLLNLKEDGTSSGFNSAIKKVEITRDGQIYWSEETNIAVGEERSFTVTTPSDFWVVAYVDPPISAPLGGGYYVSQNTATCTKQFNPYGNEMTFYASIRPGTPLAPWLLTTDPRGSSNPTPNPGTGGTFTVTGIPSTYNGKYAFLNGYSSTIGVYGFQSYAGTSIYLVQISNGSASVPTWLVGETAYTRYTANDTLLTHFMIFDVPTFSGNPIAYCDWPSVAFSDGSATRTWSSAASSQ